MANDSRFERICLIVLDSLGMGEMPDAAAWGDAGADTLGHIAALPLYFPNPDRTVTVRLNRDVRSLGKGELQLGFSEPEHTRGAATAGATVKLQT